MSTSSLRLRPWNLLAHPKRPTRFLHQSQRNKDHVEDVVCIVADTRRGIPGFVDKAAAVGAVRRTPNIEHMEQVRASEVPSQFGIQKIKNLLCLRGFYTNLLKSHGPE